MRYPKFLNKKDIIKYITPSFGCSAEPYKSRLNKSIQNIENLEYQIELTNNVYSDIEYHPNTKIERAIEFMNSYKESESSLLLSVGGGEFMTEILDYIDFEEIKDSNPKWFMGYSDNTFLTFLLPTICDVASIYGPCAPEFGSNYLEKPQIDCFDLLSGKSLTLKGYEKYELESFKNEDNPYANYNLTEDKVLTLYPQNSLNFSGRIIGGCLDVLLGIVGTKYDNVNNFTQKYKSDKIIWFFEACELNVLSIQRGLLQLERAGWFKYVSGFLIGRPLNSDPLFGINKYNSILHILEKYNVPIIMDADIGHIKPMIPIMCGSIATVTAKDNDLEITYKLK